MAHFTPSQIMNFFQTRLVYVKYTIRMESNELVVSGVSVHDDQPTTSTDSNTFVKPARFYAGQQTQNVYVRFVQSTTKFEPNGTQMICDIDVHVNDPSIFGSGSNDIIQNARYFKRQPMNMPSPIENLSQNDNDRFGFNSDRLPFGGKNIDPFGDRKFGPF